MRVASLGARTMWEFDDCVTSPLHGFAGTSDYWTRASSKPWLANVRIPTLVINARNDPFVPAASLPSQRRGLAADVVLEQPPHGGHVGFMTGPGRGPHGLAAATRARASSTASGREREAP